MRQRPNVTDPQVQETDKRRFQRMRARKQFGKEYLSEIKQCVQKTDYLVNRPTPAKTPKKTITSPIKKKTKKTEKKVNEDDLYPHVKFVIHPRIQNHKIPKFLNNQDIHQHSKTMAPVNEEQDFKRSLSSSDQAKDRYNLSTLSATNVSDSNSSNADIHDDAQRNSELNQNNINSPKHQGGSNSSDSFDDSAHLASLNNNKPQKEVKKRVSDYSDYSDSDKNVPKKPMWKFSDSERRGKSSAFSSNDFRWSKNNQINKISSSSDSDAVAIEKIKEEMKKDIEQEESDKPGTNELFFGSDSNEPSNQINYSLKNNKGNKNGLKPLPSKNKYNSPSKEIKQTNSLEDSGNLIEDKNHTFSNENNIEISSDKDIGNKNKNKSEIKEYKNTIQEPEIDSGSDDFPIDNERKPQINKNSAKNRTKVSSINSQEDIQQYSSDYIDLNAKNKKSNSPSKIRQFSSDSNSNGGAFNSIPTPPKRNGKNALYNSQYSSSGDSSRGIRNEPQQNYEQQYKSDEFKYNNIRDNIEEEEGEQADQRDEHNSNNNKDNYINSVSSQKAEKDRISPELENSLLNSKNSRKHFVETLSDGYDEDEANNHFLQNKPSNQEKNNDSSSTTPAVKEVDIPVSTEGDVDNPFNFASSTSESPAIAKKKPLEIENNIDEEEDNSDIGFGNEDNVFYTGKNSSSSEDYEVVEATTDTRENEIRENRKLDRRIYSGDSK